MSLEEKRDWWKALAILWLIPTAMNMIYVISPAPFGSRDEFATIALQSFIWPTVAYLLILSWRAAYIAGSRS